MTTNENPYRSSLYPDAAQIAAQIEKEYREAHDPKRAAKSEDNIFRSGWAAAFLVPIVGFALGTILTTRQRETHGIGIMTVSTFMAVVWWLLLRSLT